MGEVDTGGLDTVNLGTHLDLGGLGIQSITEALDACEEGGILPAIKVAQTLQRLNLDNPELAEKLPGVAAAGVKRLLELQRDDGGWGSAYYKIDEDDLANGNDEVVISMSTGCWHGNSVWVIVRGAHQTTFLDGTPANQSLNNTANPNPGNHTTVTDNAVHVYYNQYSGVLLAATYRSA